MTEYLIPTRPSKTEFTEKRSTFIGHVWPVETEEEARARVEEMKKKYHDARHNCWCYRLKDGPVRYSDDGEPQGTAGQPMLGVFQKEEVTNVCCVVTRYFGGVLLGAGGLVRAYTRSAKDALDAAGISAVRRWVSMEVPCTYARFEEARREVVRRASKSAPHVSHVCRKGRYPPAAKLPQRRPLPPNRLSDWAAPALGAGSSAFFCRDGLPAGR